jgi:dCTP deaminase
MALLTGLEIEEQVKAGRITIRPYAPAQRNPNSYDLRLGAHLRVYWRPPWWSRLARRLAGRPWCLDAAAQNAFRDVRIGPKGYVLKPGRLYLGTTVEWVGSDHYCSTIDGKSSVGRLGIVTHVTAGFIDVGFHGRITTETTVTHPVRVYAGMRFCQVSFAPLVGAVELYKGRYQHQAEAVPSRSWIGFTADHQETRR